MCFEWFTKGQHDLESDVQQQLFKEKILKLEPYEITMNGERLCREKHCWQRYSRSGLLYECVMQQLTCFVCLPGFNLFKTFFENVNLCDHRLKRQGTQLVSLYYVSLPLGQTHLD